MKTIPKLDDISDEQRRVLCSEALGKHQYLGVIRDGHKCTVCQGYIGEPQHYVRPPDPDNSADDALRLVEVLCGEGPRWRIDCRYNVGMPPRWIVEIYDMDSEDRGDVSARDAILSRAIVSAFLLAKNLALL